MGFLVALQGQKRRARGAGEAGSLSLRDLAWD
jgi:hypothetical protein